MAFQTSLNFFPDSADTYFMKHVVRTVDIQTSERVIISEGGVQVRMYSGSDPFCIKEIRFRD